MYLNSNFIKSFTSTDTCIVFQDSTGRVTRTINVCKYLDLGSVNNILWITLSGNIKVNLDFSSSTQAQQAVVTLRSALDSLYPNCALQTPVPSLPSSILSLTVNQYIAQIANSSFSLLQWYDVTDTNNVFGEGANSVFRVQTLTINDSYPKGIVLSTNKKIILNFTDLVEEESLLLSQHIITTGESQVSTDISSDYLTATNASSITSVNSHTIEADNSIITVTNCSNIVAENSRVILANSTRVEMREISGVSTPVLDLSMYSFSNVQINIGNSIGKQGREDVNTTNNEVLNAYERYIYQQVPVLSDNLTKVLNSPFDSSSAIFKFIIPNTLNGYTLTIKDFNGNVIASITDAYANKTVSFIFNNVTVLFELEQLEETNQAATFLTVSTNGQTTFSNATSWNPSGTTELFINGIKQTYMTDYYFNNSDLIWTNASFSLETTDIVELLYN